MSAKEPEIQYWIVPMYADEHWLYTCKNRGDDFLILKGKPEAIKRVMDIENATLDMSDPAKEIQSMREALKEIASRNCVDLKQQEKPCDEFENWTPDMYCPTCLARHTLKGNQ